MLLTLWQDFRFALRRLRKQPGSTTVVVLTFTLGIGLTAAMFCIVHGALRTLPFDQAEELVHLERSHLAADIESMEVTFFEYRQWRESQQSFEDLAAFYRGTANLASPGLPPERYQGAFITANAFELLGETAVRGRTFQPEEEGPASPPVVILSHHLWQERFDGDQEILGRQVRINGEPKTVIGVMAEGFTFPFEEDLWLPLPLDPAEYGPGVEDLTLEIFGRLKDGVSLDQARLDIATVAQTLEQDHPEHQEGIAPILKPYTEEFVGREVSQLLFTMLGAVFGVLIIACVNVANLLLGRSILRGRELAVRSALGARRLRLIVQMLSETFVLAAVGAVGGLALTHFAMGLFTRIVDQAAGRPFWIEFRVDPTVVAFVLGVTLLAALLAGLLPALQATRQPAAEVLKDETRGSSGLRLGRFSKGLIVAEVALTCALLVGAGLMIRSVVNLRAIDLPVDTTQFLTARVGLFETDYPEEADRVQFFHDLQDRLAARPDVAAAAITASLPGNGAWRSRLALEGQEIGEAAELPLTRRIITTPGLFHTLGVEVLAGRDFGLRDRADSLPVALVNQSFAARFFEGENPLGQRLRLPDPARPADEEEAPWLTVVGVVPDLLASGPQNEEPAAVYQPLAQQPLRFASLLVKPAGGVAPMPLAATLRSEVQSLDPNLPLYWVHTLEASILEDMWFFDIFGGLFMILGFAALFLAAVGLYGVMTFAVSQRTHEVGIRMALGARAKNVLGLILRQGLVQLAVGLALGLGLALVFARALEFVLFQVDPWDPLSFAAIATVLLVTGLTACLIPARRAVRVDPAIALRQQ